MRKVDRADRVLALLGLAVTFLVFVVQGPYDRLWKYVTPLVPVALVGGAIAVRRLPQYTQLTAVALGYARRAYKQVAAQRLRSTMLVHICDDTGRVVYKRWYRVEVTKPGLELTATKKELLFSKSAVPGMPPPCEVIASSNARQQAEPHLIRRSKVEVAGEPHFKYAWEYRLTPPLSRVHSFLEYSYVLEIPDAESAAFTSSGGLFFVERSVLLLDVEATLIAPPRHAIRVIECWVEDENGRKEELDDDHCPTVASHGQVLHWRPPYREHHRFVCRYRLLPYGSAGA